jgi:hypothetical protein
MLLGRAGLLLQSELTTSYLDPGLRAFEVDGTGMEQLIPEHIDTLHFATNSPKHLLPRRPRCTSL